MDNGEEPIVITRTYINYRYMREFKDEDFDLSSKTMIDLKVDREKGEQQNAMPYFILFMAETNSVSKNYLQTWLQLSRTIKNDKCYLGFCNLDFEKGIFNKFKKLREKEYLDHPFHWARYVEIPFMMVYRGGWPQGFYNDSMNLQKLIEYCNDYVSYYGYKVPKEHSLRPELIPGEYVRQAKFLQQEEKKRKQQTDYRNQIVADAVDF